MLKFQRFGHKESQYERPSQKWVCGRADEGSPCAMGPDHDGLCQASAECFPLREGDRWKCTRDQLRGGRCGDGPLPDGSCSSQVSHCQPRLAMRNRRGAQVRWLFLFSLSVLAILLSSSSKLGFVSPGDLSFQHGTSTDNCGDCHNNASENPFSWIATAFWPHSKEKESGLCMECHEFNDFSLKAHSINPSELTAVRHELKKHADKTRPSLLSPLRLASGTGADLEKSWACASCHKEHKGRSVNLAVLSDQQCQSCHQTQFNGFGDGHPEISGYTFQRRPRIIFDHLSHKGKYYPEDDIDFICADCHRPDIRGETMLSPAFDKGCSECHRAEIEGEGRADEIGTSVLAIPGLDVESLIQRDVPIGEWPEYAENEINPFMALFLSTDNNLKEIFATVDGLDLLDLSEANDAQLEAVQKLAWAIKRLLFEFGNEGHGAIEKRMVQEFGSQLTTNQLAAMTGGLAADVVSGAKRDWFPNLETEIQSVDAGNVPATRYVMTSNGDEEQDQQGQNTDPANDAESVDEFDFSDLDVDELEDEQTEEESEPTTTLTEPDWVKSGGWYRRDFTLFYRPLGHSDQFTHYWIDVTASKAQQNQQTAGGLFDMLSNPKAPGLCMKCHSVDKNEKGGFAINWVGKQPNFDEHSFTRFSHKPHFSLIESKGCITCHAWNKKSDTDFEATYEDQDPSVYSSNFSSLKKTVCTQCHAENSAGEGCLSCHNYHIGTFPELRHAIKTE